MTDKLTDPMQPLLTGYLMGAFDNEGRKVFKVVKIDAISHVGFEILFASGLRLAVKVEVVEPQPEIVDGKR